MSRFVQFVEWDDVPHLTEQQKAERRASIHPYELDARTRGIPALGSGAVYPFDEAEYVVDPIPLPKWCTYVYALDVGWNRTAALFFARDPASGTVYITHEHYRGQAEVIVHAEAIKAKGGTWMVGVIDPASEGRSQVDGEQLLRLYRQAGLMLIKADNAVESGIHEVYQLISTGKLKVFKTCQNFLREIRIYRRDENGKIVKSNDHLMDCLRYGVVTGLHIAKPMPVDAPGAVSQSGPKSPQDRYQEAHDWSEKMKASHSEPYDASGWTQALKGGHQSRTWAEGIARANRGQQSRPPVDLIDLYNRGAFRK